MIECPNCGSTAQPRLIDVTFEGDETWAQCYRTYKCGCGCEFTTCQTYRGEDDEILLFKDYSFIYESKVRKKK